ncbi:pro-resilin-like [Hylaeus anthracinus]|uniref:pro-resilin-like n=1 Tax=Hylaeus anthracinus TaxID=313031 RepID=UPI0023B94A3A|nr:pro-resilin-like [Hylaeus anthracinus]
MRQNVTIFQQFVDNGARVLAIVPSMDKTVRQLWLVLVVSIGMVHCEPQLNTQYGVPGNYAGNNNQGSPGGGNNFGDHHHYDNGNDNDYDQPMSYEFGYAVKDQATGNDFGRRETSDGETVRGEYRVQLPDGRTQIVTYTADWRTGFHADVRYEGTASYPDQYNTQNNGYNNNNNNNNNQGGQFGQQGNNNGGGYNNGGNNGGYNYQAPGGNFNNGNNAYKPFNGNYNNGNTGNNYQHSNGNNGNNYPFNANSLDNSYNFGARNGYNTRAPSPTYGPAFH